MNNYDQLITDSNPYTTLANMVPDNKRNYDLIHVDRYDLLTTNDITTYLETGYLDHVDENMRYLFSDSGYAPDAIDNAIEHFWPGLRDWYYDTDGAPDDVLDTAEELIHEWDSSTPGQDMLRNTPERLLQINRTDGVTLDNLEETLTGWGLDMTDPDNKLAAETIADFTIYGDHDGHNLCILIYDRIDHYVPGATFTVTDPYIALIDYANGSAMEARFTGEVTVTLTTENPAVLDKTQGYGSAAEICGLYEPNFRTSTTWSN